MMALPGAWSTQGRGGRRCGEAPRAPARPLQGVAHRLPAHALPRQADPPGARRLSAGPRSALRGRAGVARARVADGGPGRGWRVRTKAHGVGRGDGQGQTQVAVVCLLHLRVLVIGRAGMMKKMGRMEWKGVPRSQRERSCIVFCVMCLCA